ncbi:MAG: hypothetical protein HKN82_10600 [Akkermansiaceae bacterium]|nr:hypothetical protein [Akkermansiaceae bacterium]NNM30695.1 hypothetical protein [Akkermansiaceae bacterium]
MSEESGPAHGIRPACALWLMVPPLAVFLLAILLFSLVAFDIDLLTEHREGFAAAGSVNRFVETNARIGWLTSVLIFYTAFLGGGIYSLRVICRYRRGRRKRVLVGAGLLTGVAVLVYLAYSGQVRNNFSFICHFTLEILGESGFYDRGEMGAIRGVVSVLNVLSGVVPVLGLMAMACAVQRAEPSLNPGPVEELESQMGRLKTIIGVSSAIMVAGILHMVAWVRWPAAFASSPEYAGQISDFAERMGLYWGAAFSLIIATFYVPSVYRLRARAEATFRAGGEEVAGRDKDEWLKAHGLAMIPSQQIPAFFALLAPLLAEPIGSSLAKLSGSPLMGG